MIGDDSSRRGGPVGVGQQLRSKNSVVLPRLRRLSCAMAGLKHAPWVIFSHQGDLQAPCIASASAFLSSAWEIAGTGTLTPRHLLFDPGSTCTLASLKYASRHICSHQGDLLVPGMASASAFPPRAWEMAGTGTLTPRHFLFDPGFTCTLASLKYASRRICSHQGGMLVPGMASASAICPNLTEKSCEVWSVGSLMTHMCAHILTPVHYRDDHINIRVCRRCQIRLAMSGTPSRIDAQRIYTPARMR